jgi:hypothetical protein
VSVDYADVIRTLLFSTSTRTGYGPRQMVVNVPRYVHEAVRNQFHAVAVRKPVFAYEDGFFFGAKLNVVPGITDVIQVHTPSGPGDSIDVTPPSLTSMEHSLSECE